MINPILTRLLYTALGASLALGAVAFLQRPKHGNVEAVPELLRRGFEPAKMTKPTIPDLPKGAKPVAVLEGTVRYNPIAGTGKPTASGRTPTREAGRPAATEEVRADTSLAPPCDLSAIAVEVNCRAELVEAGGVYLGRTIVSGTLTFGGATRTLPETVAGQFDPVAAKGTTITVSPSVRQRTWDLGALAGVSYGTDGRPGVEAGLTWRRGWLGAYVLGEYLPPSGDRGSDWRGHGGVRAAW